MKFYLTTTKDKCLIKEALMELKDMKEANINYKKDQTQELM
jgi:hypothetical protein